MGVGACPGGVSAAGVTGRVGWCGGMQRGGLQRSGWHHEGGHTAISPKALRVTFQLRPIPPSALAIVLMNQSQQQAVRRGHACCWRRACACAHPPRHMPALRRCTLPDAAAIWCIIFLLNSPASVGSSAIRVIKRRLPPSSQRPNRLRPALDFGAPGPSDAFSPSRPFDRPGHPLTFIIII